jgi:2',3'-cyclic-nucleotide 2'-phosphodiesterase (5'-nucleotidase family)
MMNMIGYDAWCPGNHDMDISQENLARLVSIAKFPTVVANLERSGKPFPPGSQPYVILERGGVRIGIIGIMSQELYGLVIQTNLTGIRVKSPVETLQRYVDELDPQTDLLIALTHQGVTDDSILAADVHGLDLIVGGHSHTRLKTPMVVNGVYILQTGSNTENLGIADVWVADDRITKVDSRLETLWADRKRPVTRLAQLADSMQTEIDHEYDEVIGELKGDWFRREGGNTIGSYVTEAQRQAVQTDISFMNVHGIRRDIPAGPLTKRELFEALPFRNVIATFQLSGAELRALSAFAVSTRSPIIVTGITGQWTANPDGSVTLHDIRVGGNPLDEKRLYTCAANDYLVGEAKRYLGVELNNVIYLERTLFGTIEAAVRRDKVIVPKAIPSFTQTP